MHLGMFLLIVDMPEVARNLLSLLLLNFEKIVRKRKFVLKQNFLSQKSRDEDPTFFSTDTDPAQRKKTIIFVLEFDDSDLYVVQDKNNFINPLSQVGYGSVEKSTGSGGPKITGSGSDSGSLSLQKSGNPGG